MKKTACDYLAEELRRTTASGGDSGLSEDGRAALDVLSFLYGDEEAARKVVLGEE